MGPGAFGAQPGLSMPGRANRGRLAGAAMPDALSAAMLTLAEVVAQTVQAMDVLAALRREQDCIQKEISESQAVLQLREANEQLVLSAIRADEVADTARGDLENLKLSSQRDGLTGLLNRALMLDRVESAIALANRRGTRVALLFMDLDGFKVINDSQGHAAGDQVLVQVAGCLTAAVRHSDAVSRHGGDEFLVLLSEVAASADAVQVAEKILSSLKSLGDFGVPPESLCASLGIALYPDDGADARTLIERADAAMYRAKTGGRGRFALHAIADASFGPATQVYASAR